MSIGTKLKQRRKAAGWSQRELSRRSDVSQMAISNIESGKRPNPQIFTIYKLASALSCSIDDLILTEEGPAAVA